MPSTLEFDRPRDGVVVVRLNRPDRLNAINEAMRSELRPDPGRFGRRPLGACRRSHGAGRGFCAGIDMRDFGPDVPEAGAPALDRMRFQETMAALAEAIRALPQPVIAAVNGPCVGAGFALCLASRHPDLFDGSIIRQRRDPARAVGRRDGHELSPAPHRRHQRGRGLDADRPHGHRPPKPIGAVWSARSSNRIELTDRAVELAALIAGLAPLGVQLTKRALQVNTDAPSLASALELENRNQVISHATDEAAARRKKWSS